MAVRLRFVGFAALSLGLPAAAFLAVKPTTVDEAGPAMLVFLAAPLVAGTATGWGLAGVRRSAAQVTRGVGLAVGVCSAVVLVNLGLAWIEGVVVPGPGWNVAGWVAGIGSALVTSTVEELGWAAGGWRVARAAWGRAGGIVGLGLVWAAWHWNVAAFAPASVVAGMFPMGDPFSPGLAASFVVGCIAFRWLLVELWERGGVWAAAAGHAVGNVILGGAVAGGLLAFDADGPWWWIPAPTGIGFAASVALAAWGFGRWRAR